MCFKVLCPANQDLLYVDGVMCLAQVDGERSSAPLYET